MDRSKLQTLMSTKTKLENLKNSIKLLMSSGATADPAKATTAQTTAKKADNVTKIGNETQTMAQSDISFAKNVTITTDGTFANTTAAI